MREIILDTETTGLDPVQGHRIVEIGAIELINHIPSGRTFHAYLDPERDMPRDAREVHGLTTEFLKGKPRFFEIADDFLEFIGDATLVIHNAGFDAAFLNAELAKAKLAQLLPERMVDTLQLARTRHPMGPNGLDALCKRYGIDNSRRTKHGALLDAEILAEVYIELIGGKQAGLDLTIAAPVPAGAQAITGLPREVRPRIIVSKLTEAERGAHAALVQSLGPNALWREYIQERSGQSSAA
jgi:DNA polymerase III subunit epsilon